MTKKIIMLMAVVTALASCSSFDIRQAEKYAAERDWLRAVMIYRAALQANPNDVEIKSSLKQAELRAAEYYYQQGLRFLSMSDFDKAIASFEQGLTAMPEYEKLTSVLKTAIGKREANKLFKEAERSEKIGDVRSAQLLLGRAINLDPGNAKIASKLETLRRKAVVEKSEPLALSSEEPITLNFRDTDLRTAFDFLAKSFGINVIFDQELGDKRVTLFAKDVPFRKALDLMLLTTRTFYRQVGPSTIIIAADTKDKRGQYEDYVIRTFHLTNANAKQMADLLKGVIPLQKVVINDTLNTLTIRDRQETIDLADSLMRANDRKPAEMILEVEILEVNKSKAEQLGFDYGSIITAKFPEYTFADSFEQTVTQGRVALPSITFRYFKQHVGAKTLANPKIRVVNRKEARIHIGDRVPLRSSTIQETTGQTRTTFEYTDIGIRLIVQPEIYLDNSAMVQMSLEVSSLGQDLGTRDEPAYSIGTRNAQTFMLLRDGETAILGGLIRDEERKTRVKVPGLGEIPILGSLFTTTDDSVLRTDVLLTITPRIVRPWDFVPDDTRVLFSGTAESYGIQQRLAQETESDIRHLTDWNGGSATAGLRKWGLLLDSPHYRTRVGEELTATVVSNGERLEEEVGLSLEYDPAVLSLEEVDGASALEVVAPGKARAAISPAQAEGGVVGQIRLKAKQPGFSYLLIRANRAADNPSSGPLLQIFGADVIVQ